MLTHLLYVAVLFALPTAHHAAVVCEPIAGGVRQPSLAGLREGDYRLILVATEGSRRGQSSVGTLRLVATNVNDRSPRTGKGAAPTDRRRPPFYGSTDLDFAAVGAPVHTPQMSDDWPSPDSMDPIYPGVLVLWGQQPVDSGRAVATILIGTVHNRRDGEPALDGAGIHLTVRGGQGQLLQGSWSEWGVIVDGRGYFCLERLR